jgi:hypothetical protein
LDDLWIPFLILVSANSLKLGIFGGKLFGKEKKKKKREIDITQSLYVYVE